MDSSFGPKAEGRFDFTITFEHIVFYIVPSVIFLLTVPYYGYQIAKTRRLVRPGWLLYAKLAVAVALAAIQLANIVLWYKSPFDYKVGQAAMILSFASSVGVVVAVYTSHSHFLQPSLFLSIYLTATLLFDIASTRTYFSRIGLETLAHLTCALPPLKLVLVILEEVSKRSLIMDKDIRASLSSEIVSGFWNRTMFMWINPLLIFGFRNVIKNDKLPDVGYQFDSERLYDTFRKRWESRNPDGKHALIRICVSALPSLLFYATVPRLLLVGCTFAQPFLLQDIVSVVGGNPAPSGLVSQENERGAVILATALVFAGKTVTRMWFSHLENQITVSIRSMLITAIYQKSLRLSITDSSEAAAITLMTADIEGLSSLISLVYETAAMFVIIALGIWALAVYVEQASIFTVIVATLVTVCSRYLAKNIAGTRKRWNQHIQERVGATSNILAQIKDIKMTGLAPSMALYLDRLHAEEVRVALTDRRAISISFGISAFTETMTPALVVAGTLFWTQKTGTLSSARFFTILAIVTIVAEPISMFLAYLPRWAAGYACIKRIEEYLNQPEPGDPRQLIEGTSVNEKHALESNAQVGDGVAATPSGDAVRMENVTVSVDDAKPILQDVTLEIKSGQVTMIDGSVGAGKTTLLNAILGEMKPKTGTVALRSRSVAFAGQKPWLLNTTIRLNIVGEKAYNETLYRRIVFICDLDVDFKQLPDGDETLVGTGGSHLSGGQKQRISIARALYIEAELTILDDPLSALDRETSAVIRTRLFTEGNATLNGKTLVMTTSMKQHLVDADVIYRVTGEGHVQPVTQETITAELQELVQTGQLQNFPTGLATEVPSEKYEAPEVQLSEEASDSAGRDRQVFHGSFSLYAYFLRPAGVFKATSWFVSVIIASVAEKLPIIFVRLWLDHNPTSRAYYAGYAILCLSYPILSSFSAIIFFYKVNRFAARGLHTNLIDATFSATFQFLVNEDAAYLLNRYSQDLAMASQRVPGLILPSVFRGVSVLIDIAIMSAGASYAAPIIPFLLVFLVAIQRYYLQTSRQLRVLELDTNKVLTRHFSESAAGIEHIRAFQWQDKLIAKFHVLLDLTQRSVYMMYCIQQWLECVLDLSTTGTAVLLVAIAVEIRSSATANSMGLALLSLIMFSDTVSSWIRSSVAMETAFGAISRIWKFEQDTPREKQPDGAAVPADWPRTGKVELSGVTAIYTTKDATEHKPVRDVSCTIESGQTLGVVGRTGSGKTTILLSILNLLQYNGTITIDGREIRTVPPDVLRTRITIISQGTIHLKGSVRFNLDPFDPSTRPAGVVVTEEMEEDVLRGVGLWEIVTERGGLGAAMKAMQFSYGQARLFQVARAMLHRQVMDSKIVLMDECTSGLDEATEQRIWAIIEEAFAGCTKIFISHRLPGLESADAVMVVEQNQARLVKRKPGQAGWDEKE